MGGKRIKINGIANHKRENKEKKYPEAKPENMLVADKPVFKGQPLFL